MVKLTAPDGRTLEIDTERIDVSTALPQPDPNWTYTDRASHTHTYGQPGERTYPTLELRTSEPYWCAECEDEHTDTWFECPLCGEKIDPGTRIDTSPKYIPGLTSYRIDGQHVTKEEAEALLAQIQAARGGGGRS
jgi:hypothetical protein